jgi:hypothetical protein
MFWDCQDCVFGTNSKKEAARHIHDTGHIVKPEKED